MELNFNTKVDVEIDYDSVSIPDFDYESRDSSAEVKYNVAIETKSWGISGISYYGIKQEITCHINLMNKKTEEDDSFLFKIDLTDIETEGPEDFSGDICASNLAITLTEVVKIDDYTFKAKGTAVLSF